MFKVTMSHIIESQEEHCAICGEDKGGPFTVFYIDKDDDKYYFAVCRACLECHPKT